MTLSTSPPLYGKPVTVSLSIKSLCGSGTVNVPWKIFAGGTQIGSGTVSNLASGATTTVTAQWTPALGKFDFDGQVDPDQTLKELSSGTANNYRELTGVDVQVDWQNTLNGLVPSFKSTMVSMGTKSTAPKLSTTGTLSAGAIRFTCPTFPSTATVPVGGLPVPTPVPVVAGVGGPIDQVLCTWVTSLSSPSLTLFTTPPTSFPFSPPAVALSSFGQNTTGMAASSLAQAMKTSLGTLASQNGAGPAIDNFASTIAACFTNMRAGSAYLTVTTTSTSMQVEAGMRLPSC